MRIFLFEHDSAIGGGGGGGLVTMGEWKVEIRLVDGVGGEQGNGGGGDEEVGEVPNSWVPLDEDCVRASGEEGGKGGKMGDSGGGGGSGDVRPLLGDEGRRGGEDRPS